MLDQIFDFLRPLEQFSDVNDYVLEQLAGHCELRTLGRHEVLLKCGEALSCFVLKSGMLRVLARHGSGFVELACLGVGSTFGGARLAQGCSRAGEGIALVTGSSSVVNEVLEIPAKFFFKYVIAQDMERREHWASSLRQSQPGIDRMFRLELRQGGPGHSKLHKERLPVPTEMLGVTRRREMHWSKLKNALSRDVQLRSRHRRLAENIPRMFHRRAPIEIRRQKKKDISKMAEPGGNTRSDESGPGDDNSAFNTSKTTNRDDGGGARGRAPSVSMDLLLERGVKIQSMQGAALHLFSLELERRGEKAAEKKTTLSQSQMEGLRRALTAGSSAAKGMHSTTTPAGVLAEDLAGEESFQSKSATANSVSPAVSPVHSKKSRKLWWDSSSKTSGLPDVSIMESGFDATMGCSSSSSSSSSSSPTSMKHTGPAARAVGSVRISRGSAPMSTHGSFTTTSVTTSLLKPCRPSSPNGETCPTGGRKSPNRSLMAKRLLQSEKVTKQKLHSRTRSRAGRTSGRSHKRAQASPAHKHRWLATRRLYERVQGNEGPHIGRRTVVGGRWHVFQGGID